MPSVVGTSREGDMSIIDSYDLNTFLGRIGNLYVRKNLSPPFDLKLFAEGWLLDGISFQHCFEKIRDHLEVHSRQYRFGSGDDSLRVVDAIIRRTYEAS
jgi:hypothetical protein